MPAFVKKNLTKFFIHGGFYECFQFSFYSVKFYNRYEKLAQLIKVLIISVYFVFHCITSLQ